MQFSKSSPRTPAGPAGPPHGWTRPSSRPGRRSPTRSCGRKEQRRDQDPSRVEVKRGWSADVQLADPVRPQQVGEGRGRRGRGGAAAAVMVVVLVATPLSARHHDAVEADVGLRGVVHAVGDGHQGERGEGAAAVAAARRGHT